jgi:predicted RNA binding protein YcfA (HicA-like mRNA interferase family)
VKLAKPVWDQLRNKTCDELISALTRDQWRLESTRGSVRMYRHTDGRRVGVHYHPQKTYRANLLRALLDDIGWTPADLRRLKLTK